MLSQNEIRVKELIGTRLTGNDQQELLLYHFSVVRKLRAAQIFYENVRTLIPKFVGIFTSATITLSASSTTPPPSGDLVDLDSLIDNASANIDAFFMSAKSTLDSFAHELRSLYGFGGHSGDIYFEDAVQLLSTNHSSSSLQTYFSSINIRNLPWYLELNKYRRACTHESIIPVRPSIDYDLISAQINELVLKLPRTPGSFPLDYSGDFLQIGVSIKDGLKTFITDSYDRILTDIQNRNTRIVP